MLIFGRQKEGVILQLLIPSAVNYFEQGLKDST